MATPSALPTDTGEFEAVNETELVTDADQGSSASETRPAAGNAAEARSFGGSVVRPSPDVARRIEAALRASTKTQASLADLLRTAKFLSASIDAVRQANGAVLRELEELCELVDGEGAERGSLERRIQRLEHLVDETGRDAARERSFLVEEHDAFIAALVNDHERELLGLRARLAELETPAESRADSGEADERA